MSIIGIDFGTSTFTVANAAGAGAQRGGITIVLNEGTSRFTPSLVTFHEGKRHTGQLAAPLARAQYKNTISRIKSFIGRKFSDPSVQAELAHVAFSVKQGENDEIAIDVTHAGKQVTFTPTQILAMELANIIEFTQAYSGKKNVEAVVTVPAFFTDAQRRAVRDAAAIANLRLLKLVNESTATALSYGIFRRAQFGDDEEKPTNVMFVDMGNTNFSATVVAFTKSGIQVKGCAYERNVGGFYIDQGIAARMADEFQAQTKVDIRTIPKAYIKAQIAAEKVKKTLSPDGVNIAKSSIECLYQEHDFRFQLTQEEFDKMFQSLADRTEAPILAALKMAGLEKSQLDSVEMVGGGVRVPLIKRKIAEVLERDLTAANFGLSATLNQDECVARGGALQCAMLSPTIRVIPYALKDTIQYPIRIAWETDGTPNTLELLKRGDSFPAFKKITFNRRGRFDVAVEYSDVENLPVGTNPRIGTFTIGDDATLTPEEGSEEVPKIRVIMSFDEDGVFGVRSAEYMKEKKEEPETAEDPPEGGPEAGDKKPEADKKEETEDAKAEKPTPDGDAKAEGEAEKPAEGEAEAEKPKPEEEGAGGGDKEEAPKAEGGGDDAAAVEPEKKKKKKYTAVRLEVSASGLSQLSPEELATARDAEARMAQAERLLRERDEKRNDLETAIYHYRDSVGDEGFTQFAEQDVVDNITKLLDEYEDWIYTEEGFDGQKSLFTTRLDKLHELGRPVLRRRKQDAERPKAVEEFHRVRVAQLEKINNQDEKYAHLTTDDREQVRAVWATATKWLEDKVAEQAAKGKATLVVSCAEIEQRARTAANECLPILNKPVPVKEPEPEPEKKAEETAAAGEEAKPEAAAAGEEAASAAADGADKPAAAEGEEGGDKPAAAEGTEEPLPAEGASAEAKAE